MPDDWPICFYCLQVVYVAQYCEGCQLLRFEQWFSSFNYLKEGFHCVHLTASHKLKMRMPQSEDTNPRHHHKHKVCDLWPRRQTPQWGWAYVSSSRGMLIECFSFIAFQGPWPWPWWLPSGQASDVAHRTDTGDTSPMHRWPYCVWNWTSRHPTSQHNAPQGHCWNFLQSLGIALVMKDGTKHFCVNYRQQNKVTKKNVYPLPILMTCSAAFTPQNIFHLFFCSPIRAFADRCLWVTPQENCICNSKRPLPIQGHAFCAMHQQFLSKGYFLLRGLK